ncbi:MAG: SCP2 sterol-binding domain-containing protein [Deltaproteobacteria bacterium]|nr:SCP2 sterol-binding domain-containing protein [Deltaproteobacteria bacterium]
MSDKVVYLSSQWRDEVAKRLKSELSPEKMKFITTSVAFNYINCPQGKDRYLYFKCEEGSITEVIVDEGDPPKAEFTITGNYDLFAQITQGIIKSHRALMSGKLRLKGNMVKALKLASLADRLNNIMAQVPTIY